MTIQVFAVLKDFFDKEFQLSEGITSIAELKKQLILQNPEASALLDLCRFAVHDEFVEPDYPINNHDTICIVPPSSGG